MTDALRLISTLCGRTQAAARVPPHGMSGEQAAARGRPEALVAVRSVLAPITLASLVLAVCQVVVNRPASGEEDPRIEAMHPDLLVCAGYKWLLGPYQIGFAAVGERLIDAEPFEHHWSNRAGSADTTRTAYNDEYRDGARRFDVGEHANYITVPMLTAGIDQAREWGGETIQEYCAALMARIYAGLDADRYFLPDAAGRVAHILGIRAKDEDRIPGIMRRLSESSVRVSRRGSSIRVSPHVYNEPDDIEALLEVLNYAD